MPLHPAFIIGLVIFFTSAALFMGIVFSKGGWNRSKQFGVMASLIRGEHGPVNRWLTFASFAGIVLGTLTLFAGVAANDVAREKRCQARCVEAGHTRGVIGPSIQQSMTRRNTPAFVACTCTGGSGPEIELRADSL
jgi:hypothetical protein